MAQTDPKKVAIMYGWAEGPWLATRFVRELEARGMQVTDDATDADIIFAHSSGCYQIPKDVKAKRILLVGIPYGSVYHLAPRLVPKIIDEFKYHRSKKELVWWLRKLVYNGWYAVSNPGATYVVIAKHQTVRLPHGPNSRVLLVRPTEDGLMRADIRTLLAEQNYQYVEIPGTHDHCWVEPEPYIDLMR